MYVANISNESVKKGNLWRCFLKEAINLSSNLTFIFEILKVSKGAKIRNRYNQVPHLTQDTNGKVTNSHLDTTNESQEVSTFPAGDHKAHINRRTQRHSKCNTEKNTKEPQKKYRLGTVSKLTLSYSTFQRRLIR